METVKPLPGRLLAWVAAGSVFLFPSFVATIDHAGSILFVLLLLVGLVGFRGGWSGLDFWEKVMLLGMLTFFAVCALSLMNADDLRYGLRYLEKLSRILAIIPIYLTVRHWKIDLIRPFFWGCVLAGPLMLGVSIYQTVLCGAPRSYGAYHPIILGNQAILVVSVLTISLCTDFSGRKMWPVIIFSSCCALITSGLSGSRGGWLFLPFLAFLCIWVIRHSLTRYFKVLVLVVLFLLPVGIFFIENPIKNRIEAAYVDIVKFQNGTELNTSIGDRFLMWRLAVELWRENPILGTGLGDYPYDVKKKMAAGLTGLDKPWRHAHNIYFTHLATTGLVGLFSLLSGLFAFPFLFFYKKSQEGGAPLLKFGSLAGLTCVICFAVFGLSEGWTARSTFVTSYVFYILVFATGLLRENKCSCN